jgi:hypothetical protein
MFFQDILNYLPLIKQKITSILFFFRDIKITRARNCMHLHIFIY